MLTLIGYRRSSTSEQVAGYEQQEAQLLATGCTRVFGEMVSSVAQRDQLDAALQWVRSGDVLVVTRLDRLARSTADLLGIVAKLEAKGVGLRILDFGGSEVEAPARFARNLRYQGDDHAHRTAAFRPRHCKFDGLERGAGE